jgi:hypothetical protein
MVINDNLKMVLDLKVRHQYYDSMVNKRNNRPLSQVGSRRKRCPGQFGQDGMGSIPATPSPTKRASYFPPSRMPASIEISIKLIVCLSASIEMSIKLIVSNENLYHIIFCHCLIAYIRKMLCFFLNGEGGDHENICRF